MGSVRANFMWNAAYQVVRIAIPLVTTPYLTRMLGSESLGTYSYTYTIALYFVYFAHLGFHRCGNRAVARARGDKGTLSKTFWSICLGQLAVGLAVFGAYVGFALLQGGAMGTYALIWAMWVLAEVADISWLFYGLEDFKTITVRNVLIRIGVLVGIFALVKGPDDLWLYCALQACSFALNSVVLWVLVRGRIEWARVPAREVLGYIRVSLTLFIPVIAISLYTQINKVILGALCDMSQVAFYDNAHKIVVIPLTVVQSIGTVMFPRMSSVLANGEKDRAASYLADSFWISMAMSIAFVSGILGVARDFVPVFFGPGFEECVTLLPLLALIIPACAVSGVTGSQLLVPSGRDVPYVRSVLAGAAVNIALCIALIPTFAATGAAIATVSAELVVMGVQLRYVRDDIPIGQYCKSVAPFLVFGLAEFACIKAVSLSGLTGVALLCAEIAVGGAVFAILGLAYLLIRGDERLRLFGLGRFIKR